MTTKKVLILMGSDSDLTIMQKAAEALKKFEISFDMHIASAHRTPEKVRLLAKSAREKGYLVIISGAGMAAHLSGVVAAHTTLPVIGVPLASGSFGGSDALLATVQMPPGIPVGCVGVGAPGAYNAGLLAVAIIATSESQLAAKLADYRKELVDKVEEKDAALQRQQ